MTQELEHYGIKRRSGRYPWGSGENPYQRSQNFYSIVNEMRAKGISDKDIAASFASEDAPFSTTQLKQTTAIARAEIRAADRAQAITLLEKGMSVSAIGRRMGKNESTIRALLDDTINEKQQVLSNTIEAVRSRVDEEGYIDIGAGSSIYAGVSKDKFNTAVAVLMSEGYNRYYVPVKTGVGNNETTVMVLAKPGDKKEQFPEIMNDPSVIKPFGMISTNKGESFKALEKPKSVDSSRVQVVYGSEGGAEADGLIELRRGVPDLDMGNSRYAQVRILVDNERYLKGMAVVRDDLPKGVDIRFNTVKENTGNKLDAMKTLEDGLKDPFGGSANSQKYHIDKDGKEHLTALNIVTEEGKWDDWNAKLSSQMLSKQPKQLAEQQLKLFADGRKAEFEEIKRLTNPALKKELLREFADKADADAVDLQAMGLPRTSNRVLIPIKEMKDTEVYAPQYKQGETVVLIRHPHGGIFEIPQLKVNNRVPAAKNILGNAVDAIGINAKVAEQLSGADFDGDTVLVIPNNDGQVKSSRPIKSLIDFNPRDKYKGFEGMKPMSDKTKEVEMGVVSNLITDMTIQGANKDEIVRAVKHSMVVIDAAKHKLNYRQSFIDHGIAELKARYQPEGGASTIISRARSETRVQQRTPRRVADGGPIDPETGELRWTPKKNSSFEVDGRVVIKTEASTKMRETSDARTLMSTPVGQPIERVYADHANALKSMANQARLELMRTPNQKRVPSAAKAYKAEVESLNAKLTKVQSNAPRERQAQIIARTKTDARVAANPGLKEDSGRLKKVHAQELRAARESLGAAKGKVDITPQEWEAIQSGAFSHTPLTELLREADPVKVKEYATPKGRQSLSTPTLSRARSMLNRGYTQAEVAEALGVSVSSIQELLKN